MLEAAWTLNQPDMGVTQIKVTFFMRGSRAAIEPATTFDTHFARRLAVANYL
ncbi:hypothetical protein PY650_11890 [Rhizobium calliandrae]|uniref:Uncharacterized protein n=1 Tax=Rhizobium calliandrae TaxID=1312182 RepID=A0ABT7KCK3_9HYPH|nr:hypothetical protein [Rhizobium calliandrae]MDL2406345.1 hypothetical protein [Rhizobium calliandrae]